MGETQITASRANAGPGIAQNKPLTVSYVIMRHAKIAFLTH